MLLMVACCCDVVLVIAVDAVVAVVGVSRSNGEGLGEGGLQR